MPKLKNRQLQVPGGLKFKIREMKYQAGPYRSFDTIVNEVERLVRSNPVLAQKLKLPMDRIGIENMVDAYNAMLCEQSGWLHFIEGGPDAGMEGQPPPKWVTRNTNAQFGRNVAGGLRAIAGWIGEGAQPVLPELSQKRASICATCPLNRKVELRDYFVRGASELIRRQIEFAKGFGLTTTHDENLGVCSACDCPMKLKVHVPIGSITEKLSQKAFDDLVPECWIRKEQETKNVPIGTL